MKAIYIKASWCVPCRVTLPKFKAECERLGIPLEILDADEDEERVTGLGVRNVPYAILVSLDGGEEIARGRAEEMMTKLKDYAQTD